MKYLHFRIALIGSLLFGTPAYAVTQLVQNGTSSARIPFLLVDSATGQIGQTGQASNISIKVSINGSLGASSGGNITEVDSTNLPGVYYYTPTSTETGTNGFVALHITDTGCQTVDTSAQIVAFNPNDATALGLSNLLSTNSTVNTLNSNLTAAGIAQDVWNANQSIYVNSGSTGLSLNNASSASTLTPASIWTYGTRTLTAQSDTSGTTTLLSRVSSPVLFDGSGYLKSDPQTSVSLVSGQNVATVGGQAPPTNWSLASINGSGQVPSSNLPSDYLSSAEETQLSGASTNASTAATQTTASNIAGALLNATVGSYNTSGSVGAKINSGGSGSAPSTAQIAAAILADPSNLIATNSSGQIQAGNLPSDYLTSPEQSKLTTASAYTFPTNFSTLGISNNGGVTVGTNADKTGYTLASGGLSGVAVPNVTVGGYISGQDPATLLTAQFNAVPEAILTKALHSGWTVGQTLVALEATLGANVTNSWNSSTHTLTTTYQFTGDGAPTITHSTTYNASTSTPPVTSQGSTGSPAQP